MILKDVLKGLNVNYSEGGYNGEIRGIAFDSGKAGDGYLFVALKGEKTDGHKYIGDAVDRGAGAVMVENMPSGLPDGVTVIQVGDTRRCLARVSSNFYRDPSRELCLVGITGTNGKTTVTYLLESIWTAERSVPGVIGTIDYRYPGVKVDSSMTTPESLELMRILREMKDAGVGKVAMEVSSHALDKDRVLGCHFDAAVFTNLTQDHLDYHKTMDSYLESKKKLFTQALKESAKNGKRAVINIDDPYGKKIADELGRGVITYSAADSGSAVYAERSEITGGGIRALIVTPSGNIKVDSSLYGAHNLSNILAAVAASVATGSPTDSIEQGISSLRAVPGRLEQVYNPFGFSILVDYAHTPDALENVLEASRSLTDGRLILVFGCGGDRDRTKRPRMGAIGDELSDILIVTSDNPRTEPPDLIISDIEAGISEGRKSGHEYYCLPDRAEAIRTAVSIAAKGDTVLIAGKGHEDYQILGVTKHHFDDREIAALAVSDRTC